MSEPDAAAEPHDWVSVLKESEGQCEVSWCGNCGTVREGNGVRGAAPRIAGSGSGATLAHEGRRPMSSLFYVPGNELPQRWPPEQEPACGWQGRHRLWVRQPDQICGRCARPMTRADGEPFMERYPIRVPGGAEFLICQTCAHSFDKWLGTWAVDYEEYSS